MNSGNQNLSLGEAASRFLANLVPGDKGISRQAIYEFVRWLGGGRSLAGLTASEVANYGKQLSSSHIDQIRKIELIRAFLVYAKKEGWSEVSLSAHLKVRKGRAGLSPSSKRALPEPLSLTRQGYAKLEAELEALKTKRLDVIDEMRRAAADKDFRENAPLAAAKEQSGHLEGRIRGLEAALKSVIIVDDHPKDTLKVSIGDSIILCDLDSGEELRCIIVHPREIDPARGKISSASPIGKAVIGRGQGEVVEVVTPAGKLRYQIKQDE